jgi:hypothetical protein
MEKKGEKIQISTAVSIEKMKKQRRGKEEATRSRLLEALGM